MTDEEIASRLSCSALGTVRGSFAAGMCFGDWRLTAFISRGGTSEVYAAEHVTLGTPAAVKILLGTDPGRKGTDPGEMRTGPEKMGTVPDEHVEKERFEHKRLRFEQEARLLAGLNSPHFPNFYAFGEAHGHVYLAEELLEPGELPCGDRPRAKYLLSICEGLRELHAWGVVHRDLKPTNILFRRKTGEPVIVDLGLAKSVDVPIASDGVSIVDGKAVGVGTPEYAAPEQFMGGDITPASDIHALGVLAEKLLDERATSRQKWGSGILSASSWRHIIRRATSSIASERYQSVDAFATAIRRRHWLRNGLVGAGVAAVLALVFGLAVLFSEPSLPSVLNLRGQTLVLHEPIVLKPGRTYRVIGPGTLDADISGPGSTTLWMTNCVVLNRARVIYPDVKLKYHLADGVYLNFININESLAPWRWKHEYLGDYDGAFNDVRFGGPDTLSGLLQLQNTERWFNAKPD